jgi:rhamnosyltransferase
MRVSTIIPTFMAGDSLPGLISGLMSQVEPPDEVIIIDSSSPDNTVEIARAHNCMVNIIERNEFGHGRTRNHGARLAHGEIFIFLTQDVMPVNNGFISNITLPIRQATAVAVTGRQVPYPDANPIEVFSRRFNYPDIPHTRALNDLPRLGIKTFFFSNSASAFDRETFWKTGSFSEQVIVDEDLELCARLLNQGYKVAYQAESMVYHSHNYRLSQLFRRYFDIGVFYTQAKNVIGQVSPNAEGRKYFQAGLKYLRTEHLYSWIPRFLAETVIKYLAYRCGENQRIFPTHIKKILSGQPYFWDE